MRSIALLARRLFLLVLGAALFAAFGCGGGGGGGGTTTPPAALACSDGGAAAANSTTMRCGSATNSTTEIVNVVLGGPASGATTLRGLNFDVTYDASKLDYVPAATATSQLFSPNALVAVTLLNGLPGHLVVSIQEFGGLPNVSVGAGQHTVLSLTFRRTAGMSFAPTPLAFANADATSASATITFSSGVALSYQ